MYEDHVGLVDLIAGVTPTFSGWTVDPSDASDITDGSLTTFCTTGSKTLTGGWQYANFFFDLGAVYNVVASGVVGASATAGTVYYRVGLYNGAAYINSGSEVLTGTLAPAFSYQGMASKIMISFTSTGACDLTPNFREFHAWRL